MRNHGPGFKLIALVGALAVLAGCTSGANSRAGGEEPVRAGQGFKLKPVSGFASPPPASLVAAAKAEGGEVVWYESTPDARIPRLVKGFVKRYPWARVRHVNLAGSILNGRVAQETEAGVASADVAMNDAAPELAARNLLLDVDWKSIGIPDGMPRTKHAVATAATIYCIQYNTKLVSAEEAPKSFDDLLDPKWKGKVGYYGQPYFFSHLVTAWGSKKTDEYVEKFAAQNPKAYTDTESLTQFVAAGDVPVALTVYQTYLRGKEIGLPVEANLPDPATMTLLYTTIPKTAAHPNSAKLFINWLHSEEGQKAYMGVARRGNPLYPDSEYGKLVAGRKLATWGPDQAEQQTEWLKKYADQLQR